MITEDENPKPQWPTGPDEHRIVLEAIEAFREHMEVETSQQERNEVESVLDDFVCLLTEDS